MEGCTNLTADFRNNILQRWTSCGFGGIYLNGIYDIPEWFKIVNDMDNIVFFEVPQIIMGRDLKGLTICFIYSSRSYVHDPEFENSQEGLIGIIVRNLTKQTALNTRIAFGSVKPNIYDEPEDDYLWQGQLSNDVLGLVGGDHISILVRPDDVDFVRVKKTGVHLEWDKVMKENNPDPHLYDWETNRDFLGETDDEARLSHDASVPSDQVSAIDEESAVEDDPLGHGDLRTRLSLSTMENLDFSGGADDGAGQSHGAFVRTNQSSAVDEQLEWDKVMKENMDNPDPHLYDLETNRDLSGGVDDAFFRGSVIHEQLARSHDARPDDGAGRSHDAFVRTNQSSAVDEQLAVEGCFAHLKSFLFSLFFNCFSHPR
ncbi:hypothetical protein CerSpe_059770 [Prunus speciosa]